MATCGGRDRFDGWGYRRWPLRAVYLLLSLGVLLALPGCGGCTKDPAKLREELEKKAAEERAKKKQKPKPPFELSRLITRPSGARSTTGPSEELFALGPPYKPGHWTSFTLAAKTNHFDFLGDLELVVGSLRGGRARPLLLPGTPFELPTSRQVALPKRQPKLFEAVLFVPVADTPQQIAKRVEVSCRLNTLKGGRRSAEKSHSLRRMPSYQYHFVVLARRPESYAYLKDLVPVTLLSSIDSGAADEAMYRVVLMAGDRRLALPSHALFWTSIGCVLWDDAEPGALDPVQQDAMLDWLHWGGQLIVSGPDTLDTLRDSFLGPYLPAATGGARELTGADFEPLQSWSQENKSPASTQRDRFVPTRPLAGVKLQKHLQARFMPGSGELFVERRVGRGRIVVSAFRLGDRELTAWAAGRDEVFNAFLLRWRPREFKRGRGFDMGWQVAWADGYQRLDARRTCNLRYFTRDTGAEYRTYAADVAVQDLGSVGGSPGPGVAAWNDFNPVARAARSALLDAAQIEIPDRTFVVWMVAGYLLILVPLNWAVFRMVGRVEWAWVAAPIVAVAGTVVVIRLAQLDIGFARSRTEVAVVEIQGDYPRAHVTRYNALYTSLATSYDSHFGDRGAVVQPFPNVDHPGEARVQDRRTLWFRRGKEASLLGYPVESNSTGLIHSEEMADLGGAVRLSDDGRRVINQTLVTLHDAGVMRKMLSGRIQIAWAGTLEPGAQAALVFRDAKLYKSGLPFWPEHRPGFSVTATAPGSGELNLRALIDSAQEPGDLQPGEARLLAALKEEIPGMTVSPAAPQVQHAALVIAHLKYGPGEDPQADRNTRPKGAVGGGGLSSRPANPPSSQPAPWDASIRTERLKTDGQQTAGLHADAAAAGHRWTTFCCLLPTACCHD